jgi:hypothetical protein
MAHRGKGDQMTGYPPHDANLARLQGMRERADQWRRARPDRIVVEGHLDATTCIGIRRAVDTDRGTLARLAALDGVSLRSGETLIAEVEGEPQAAIHVASGATFADPFRPTADLVELLSLRAARLSDGPVAHRRLRLALLRLGRSRSA